MSIDLVGRVEVGRRIRVSDLISVDYRAIHWDWWLMGNANWILGWRSCINYIYIQLFYKYFRYPAKLWEDHDKQERQNSCYCRIYGLSQSLREIWMWWLLFSELSGVLVKILNLAPPLSTRLNFPVDSYSKIWSPLIYVTETFHSWYHSREVKRRNTPPVFIRSPEEEQFIKDTENWWTDFEEEDQSLCCVGRLEKGTVNVGKFA